MLILIMDCVFCLNIYLTFIFILRQPTSTLFPYTTLFRSGLGTPATPGIPARPINASCADRAPCRSPGCSPRSEEHTSELQSQFHLVCRLLLEKKNIIVIQLIFQ